MLSEVSYYILALLLGFTKPLFYLWEHKPEQTHSEMLEIHYAAFQVLTILLLKMHNSVLTKGQHCALWFNNEKALLNVLDISLCYIREVRVAEFLLCSFVKN